VLIERYRISAGRMIEDLNSMTMLEQKLLTLFLPVNPDKK